MSARREQGESCGPVPRSPASRAEGNGESPSVPSVEPGRTGRAEGVLRLGRIAGAILASLTLALALAFVTLAPASASEAEEIEPAIAFAGRVAGDLNATRVFFDLDRRVWFESLSIENPDRIVIDAPSIFFRFLDAEAILPRGLVSGLRYGAMAKGRSRIVLTLAAPARLKTAEVIELDSGNFRLLLELSAVNRAEFSRLSEQSKRSRSRAAPSRASPEAVESDKFAVVIDPGHGGIDGGAVGPMGEVEKDVTLDVARRLRDGLADESGIEVRLVRDEDLFVSLDERVAFASDLQADLMISLHADSLPESNGWESVRGASIYTLSRKASDRLAHQLAEAENMADAVAGFEAPEAEAHGVSGILADLAAREAGHFSNSFARILEGKMKREVQMLRNPLRSAGFRVLQGPGVPSVLIELGYLSNAEDEKLLSDPQWRNKVASILAEAIKEFHISRTRRAISADGEE